MECELGIGPLSLAKQEAPASREFHQVSTIRVSLVYQKDVYHLVACKSGLSPLQCVVNPPLCTGKDPIMPQHLHSLWQWLVSIQDKMLSLAPKQPSSSSLSMRLPSLCLQST